MPTPPTLTEAISAFTTFVADYGAYVGISVIIGLITWGTTKLLRAGR